MTPRLARRVWRRSVQPGGFRWYFGHDLERHHVGTTITQRVIRSDDSKVRRIP